MKFPKHIARCYRVFQHERNENASFLSIFNGGTRPKWRFSNFPRFWKNANALGFFNCIFENNSLRALFGQNMKKVKISKLSPDSRYLQKLALKPAVRSGDTDQRIPCFWQLSIDHHVDVQLVFSWALKLARKCETKYWFPCCAYGRSGVRSRDYQIISDG